MSQPSLILLALLVVLGSVAMLFIRAATPAVPASSAARRSRPAAPASAAAPAAPVIDLIQEGLRLSRPPMVQRALRRPAEDQVEMFVGIGEVGGRGMRPTSWPADTLTGNIHQLRQRMVRLRDESDTGLGIEGGRTECMGIAAGDLVALRTGAGQPPVLGTVARCAPTRNAASVVIGVRKLGVGVQEVHATRQRQGKGPESRPLMFVVGADPGGREDGFLISERTYEEGGVFSATIQQTACLFRYDRVRERGRGWLLVGFEVIEARPVEEAAPVRLALAA